MGRFFTPRYEFRSMLEGINEDLRRFAGTRVYWYRLDTNATQVDDVYDMGVGRVYQDPFAVECVGAIRQEGNLTTDADGLFTRDYLEMVVAWDEIERRGMTDIATNTDRYLRDRVLYDDVYFTPRNAQVEGSIQEMDTIVRIMLLEVRPDEVHYDPQMTPPVV